MNKRVRLCSLALTLCACGGTVAPNDVSSIDAADDRSVVDRVDMATERLVPVADSDTSLDGTDTDTLLDATAPDDGLVDGTVDAVEIVDATVTFDSVDLPDGVDVADGDSCPADAPVRCGDACFGDTDSNPLRCGSSCALCAAPPFGVATCSAGSCGFTCSAGHVLVGSECVDAPPPRPIRPITNSRSTVRNPTLNWILPAGVAAARITVCRDRPCSNVELEIDATGESVRVPRELAAGVWYWNLRSLAGGAPSAIASATWQLRTPETSAPIESSWASRPDFNGDGLDDFGITSGTAGNGAMYYGNRDESTAPGPEIPGANADAQIQAVGDLDGDGYSDFLVDSNFRPVPGQLQFLSGNAAGGAFTLIDEVPHSVARGIIYDGSGDVDGDGYSDIVALTTTGSLQLLLGGRSITGPGEQLTSDTDSSSVALLDMDADGFDDILMEGSSLRWAHGGATATREVRTLLTTGERGYGLVFGIGDANHDGYLDAAWIEQRVSAPRIAATLILGGAAGPTAGPLQDVVPDGEFQVIGGPIDADGDSVVDVSASSGAVLGLNVVHSRASGFDRADSTQIETGCVPGGISQIGDWNGDGALDSIVQCGSYASIIVADHSMTPTTFRLLRIEPARPGEPIGFFIM